MRLLAGGALFLFSYSQIFFEFGSLPAPLIGLFWLAFFLGLSLICDSITLWINKTSLLQTLTRKRSRFLLFIFTTTTAAILLDGTASWLAKLWFYPYNSVTTYLIVFVPAFWLYLLMIAESYLASKAVIDLIRRGRTQIGHSFRGESRAYELLGAVGLLLIALGSMAAINSYAEKGGYFFNNVSEAALRGNFLWVVAISIGVWFTLEFFEHYQHRSSLLKDLIHHYPSPLLAIISGSLIVGLALESLNTIHHAWIYQNWPWQEYQFLGIPVAVFIGWPLHYIVFLSLFRVLMKKESEEVWKSDLIK